MDKSRGKGCNDKGLKKPLMKEKKYRMIYSYVGTCDSKSKQNNLRDVYLGLAYVSNRL